DGTEAYVTNETDGTVSVINVSTHTLVGTAIPVGSFPRGVAIRQDGKRAYVVNLGSHTVSVIRTAKKKVVATVAVGVSPFAIGIRP
ncbi:MAG: YncE family protein, partial [Methylocella sp.]